jgi:hypothetical protein
VNLSILYDIIYRYFGDNNHDLTIIRVNPMIKYLLLLFGIVSNSCFVTGITMFDQSVVTIDTRY